MIQKILPPEVVSRSAVEDDPLRRLLPEEAEQIRNAVESRRREFTTTRSLAREALKELGIVAGPILQLPTRAPLWPDGVVGSITHCEGYRAVAVAKTAEVFSVGIDAEPHRPLPAEVRGHVMVDRERAWIATAPAGIHWDRVLFSAKESVYKTCFPVTGMWLGFEDVVITFDDSDKSFKALLPTTFVFATKPELRELQGRFLVEDDLILTAITIMR